jgi:putative transposase
MGRKRYTPEQIVHLMREAEVLLSQGKTVPVMCRELGFGEQTYYRWRRTHGGLGVSQARRLKELGQENARLKHLLGRPTAPIAAGGRRDCYASLARCRLRDRTDERLGLGQGAVR